MTKETSHFFNINDLSEGIHRNLAEGVEARVFPGDQAMVSIVTLEPNKQGSIHSHPEEQWGILLEGNGIRIQNGVEHEIGPGSFWLTPGNVEHGIIAGSNGLKVMDVFAPPREAYKKSGSGFAVDG
ncbi:MAG: cupin domain-containing protein [Pseudomonadota bacterium]